MNWTKSRLLLNTRDTSVCHATLIPQVQCNMNKSFSFVHLFLFSVDEHWDTVLSLDLRHVCLKKPTAAVQSHLAKTPLI